MPTLKFSIEESIRTFYKSICGKEPTNDELAYWLKEENTNINFSNLYNNILKYHKSSVEVKSKKLPISLVVFAKNNED
jgi:hypothetical protein